MHSFVRSKYTVNSLNRSPNAMQHDMAKAIRFEMYGRM